MCKKIVKFSETQVNIYTKGYRKKKRNQISNNINSIIIQIEILLATKELSIPVLYPRWIRNPDGSK